MDLRDLTLAWERAFWTLAGWIDPRLEPRPGGGYDRRLLEANSRRVQGRPLNLQEPVSLVDKISWLKLYHRHPLLTLCSDKLRVREFVAFKGLGHLTVPILQVCRSVREIDWDSLPPQFVLKPNHSSQMVLFCRDPDSFDRARAAARLRRWMRRGRSLLYAENNYRGIPRRILIEPLLGEKTPLVEHKVHCFCGEVFRVVTILDRTDGRLTLSRNDLSWNRIPKTGTNPHTVEVSVPRPTYLDELVAIAETLSGDFLRCRVDVCHADGRLWFGEITFYSEGGHRPRATEEYDRLEASRIRLDRHEEFLERGRSTLQAFERWMALRAESEGRHDAPREAETADPRLALRPTGRTPGP
ncbi:MAG: ATP-grasp fold amidoligase family protein [Fimbriimonadales bacterium]